VPPTPTLIPEILDRLDEDLGPGVGRPDYRKAYLRWIDTTARRPDLRAARIAEVVDLLAVEEDGGTGHSR
jgi:hypothetical protein